MRGLVCLCFFCFRVFRIWRLKGIRAQGFRCFRAQEFQGFFWVFAHSGVLNVSRLYGFMV